MAVCLLASTVLTACSVGYGFPAPQDSPTEAPATASTSTSPSTSTRATVVDIPQTLPVTRAGGLIPVIDSTNDPADARFTSVFDLPAASAYISSADAYIQQSTAKYEKQRRDAADGGRLPTGQLRVTSDVIAAAGSVVGITIRSFSAIAQGTGAGQTATTTSYVVVPDGASQAHAAQPSAGSVITSSELFTDQGRLNFATSLVNAITAHPELVEHKTADLTTDFIETLTRDVRVQPDGSLVAVIGNDTGLTFPAAGAVAVRVPADVAANWLGEQGHSVLEQLTSDAPFAGAGPIESNTPNSAGTAAPKAPTVDCHQVKCVALTFDDGPGPYTTKLLRELAAADVQATFMVVGRNVAAQPDVVRQEVAAGHEVGNHTWEHSDLTKLTAAQIDNELDETRDAIEQATGGYRPTLVRPPYGALDKEVRSVLARRGQAAALWNVDTEDWKNRNTQLTTQRALADTQPGSIVLMHDIHPTTVEAVPNIIKQFRAQGFTFVTLSQLLGNPLTPGRAYGQGPHPQE